MSSSASQRQSASSSGRSGHPRVPHAQLLGGDTEVDGALMIRSDAGVVAPTLCDARWYPADIHVPRREYGFLAINQAAVDGSVFMDERIDAPLADAVPVPVEVIAQATLSTVPLAWLLHTSFCCSTLLARMLHVPPCQTVLKEPLVLRRLSDARYANWSLDGLVEPTVRLLARPWDEGGTVVLKPTHAALNIAVTLLDASPDSRGVILTSSLDDFLISNLKKPPATQAKIPALAERALSAGAFHARLPAGALAPPDLAAAAALQWAAQRELTLDIALSAGPQRLRFLDAATLLAEPQATAWQCAQWLRLPVPASVLEQRVADVLQQNAKAVGMRYSPETRSSETRMMRAQYRSQIASAQAWFDRMVLPAMRRDAITPPVLP